MTETCLKILEDAYANARKHLDSPFIQGSLQRKVAYVVTCPSTRAGARFILACTLAKVDKPGLDIRKPFTRGTEKDKQDSYSGREYDESYVHQFITKHELPCLQTTAFLTPGFRTKQVVLTKDVDLGGRPAEMYRFVLEILDAIHTDRASAEDVLTESIRLLIIGREERKNRLAALLKGLRQDAEALPLSCEDIITVIQQHLACKHSSRLPVLMIAAAYETAATHLQKRVLSLQQHTAADKQTGAMGDVEISLLTDEEVVTTYEMKGKAVCTGDIDIAIQKIVKNPSVQNYIFITTEPIAPDVREYAAKQYAELGGTEIAILGCVDFLRHFLHLFHWIRTEFLNTYQEMVLDEPESGVRQPLKEAFLALRQAAESGE